MHRAQYFSETDGVTFLEKIIKYGNKYQENLNSSQVSMFDNVAAEEIDEPVIPACEEWSTLEKLNQEKEVVGIFISGHPLDDFKLEIESFGKGNLSHLKDLQKIKGHELAIAAICTGVQDRMTKKGKPFGVLTVEDYYSSNDFFVFGEDYIKLKPYFVHGQYLFIKGKAMPRKWSNDENELEFKISNIELLSELRETKVKSITVNIENENVTEELINTIKALLDIHQGKCEFSVQVKDKEEGVIKLNSRSKRVDLNDDFLHQMDQIKEISYKLN